MSRGASTSAQPAEGLNGLSESERRVLFHEFADARVDYPKDKTLIDLFEEQVGRSFDQTAAVFNEHVVRYCELDGKANSLTNHLHASGVGKGDVVPIVAGHGLEFLTSIIALMKLGTIFVPFDAQWPEKRIEMLMRELRPKVVLATRPCQALVPTGFDVHVVDCVDLPVSGAGQRNSVFPSDAIYGFYTSGSTGTPKCAINIHRGLVNRLCYMTRRYAIRTEDVVLQNSRNAFDPSIWQLLWPLINGARVVIPDDSKGYNLLETIDIIEKHGITMMDFVPSIFNVLVDYVSVHPESIDRLRSLRQLLIGGEEINAPATYKFKSLLPHVGITNTYGPTETSIGTVFYEVGTDAYDPIPIGRPIDNVSVVLLDEFLHPVPVGVTGELYIAGDCMGQGYLNDPVRTKEAFIDNPFADVPGDRLYRTGDFAYYLDDGNLQFVGRKDQQIQVRGVRVELGEIENVLLQCPGVKEARVVVDNRIPGREDLVACVVTESAPDEPALLAHLKRHLISYMIPARFVYLEAMPLNDNGKIDRKALHHLVVNRKSPSQTSDAQHGNDDSFLIDVWKELLGTGQFDPGTSFFALGGDSLGAIQIICRIKEATGITVNVEDVYDHPTLDALAGLIADRKQGAVSAGVKDDGGTCIEQDLRLADRIEPDPACDPVSGAFQHVFLTGATGFVGAHLLGELLSETDATVSCLVRAESEDEAQARIRDNLARYHLWNDEWVSRIVPVPGDLGRPLFGLTRGQFNRLSELADTVIHNGALVNFVHNYVQHRGPNVLGTAEILRLACTRRLKVVHYVSTLSVLPMPEALTEGMTLSEDHVLPDQVFPTDGYSRSKWVAEKLIGAARSRKIPVNVYRLGEVMPHTHNGVPNPKALWSLLLNSFVKLGLFPRSEAKVDYTPVDYVSRAVVHLAGREDLFGSTFHLCHPEPVPIRRIMESFRASGIEMAEVPAGEYQESLRTACSADRGDCELTSLSYLIQTAMEAEESKGDHRETDVIGILFLTNTESISKLRTDQALAGSSIRCPAISPAMLRPYADHCKRFA